MADGMLWSSSALQDPETIPLDQIDMSHPELWRTNVFWGYFKRMRREAPVHYTPESPHGPYWSVTRYNDIMHVDTNHKIFSSEPGITIADQDEDFQLPMFIAMDQPKHDEQRKAVQPIVAPDMLAKMEPLIRERICHILDNLPRNEPFDWVDRVSIELTGQMLATLFDVPQEDRRKLTRWSDVATGRDNEKICPGGEEQFRAELLECAAYFTNMWNERVNAPPRFDLISMMAHSPAMKNMPPNEFLGNLILLIVGGNDTTRNSLTGGVYALNQNPDQYAKLRANHGLIESMVPEIIRWQTPLAHMRRRTLVDTEIAGVKIPAGEKVIMWYVSGNRDETVIENPDAFIIDRARPRQHLSFGFGIHRCVGNRLGEMQLRVTWEEILKRFDKIEVVEEPTRVPSCFVKGYERMMVRIPG
ncbi:MAG: cytochrome P450 [Alphaproteobacteria bacterium]|nr:cytochrome P450 [Alphaproteobacteria bacterium]